MGRNVNVGGTSFTLLNGGVDLSSAKPVLSGTWGSGATYGELTIGPIGSWPPR